MNKTESLKNWLSAIGVLSMSVLLAAWYIFTHIGGYLSATFPESPIEQVGNAITSAGNAALNAFIMILFVAFVVVVIILYIRERIKSSY